MSFLNRVLAESGRQLRQFALTTLLFCIPYTASHAACSVHDQGCIYHGFQSDVHTDYPITTDTTAVFYTIGTTPTTGTPSKVDFDNKVWLPSMTGDKMFGTYTTPTGPYIINSTPYGASHPPADTFTAGDANLLVYPSQYKITFNQNTAVANHTGDFNGGENGNIPNATGCPNMPGAANCEAVVISGNVPSGFYTQQARVFNSQGNPNPSVDVQMGVYTTGNAVLVVPSHTTVTNKTATYTEDAARYTLNGTGATTPATVYEIYNRGFNSTAYGVASFDQSFRRNLGWSAPYWVVSHDSGYQYKMRNHLARIDTMTTAVGPSGGYSTAIQKGKVRVDGKDVLAVMVPQPKQISNTHNFDFSSASQGLLLSGVGSTLPSSGSKNILTNEQIASYDALFGNPHIPAPITSNTFRSYNDVGALYSSLMEKGKSFQANDLLYKAQQIGLSPKEIVRWGQPELTEEDWILYTPFIAKDAAQLGWKGLSWAGGKLTGDAANSVIEQSAVKLLPAQKVVDLPQPIKTIAIDEEGNALIGTWTSTNKLSAPENALKHWLEHSKEFPEYTNATQYAQAVQKFVESPPVGTLIKVRPLNGDMVFYNPRTNIFAIKTIDGSPKTMFKPDPLIHGFKDNLEYFNAQ